MIKLAIQERKKAESESIMGSGESRKARKTKGYSSAQ